MNTQVEKLFTRDEGESDKWIAEMFRTMTGSRLSALSEDDTLQILRWLNPHTEMKDLFSEGKTEREFTLDEAEDDSIILRLHPNGAWERIRLTWDGPHIRPGSV